MLSFGDTEVIAYNIRRIVVLKGFEIIYATAIFYRADDKLKFLYHNLIIIIMSREFSITLFNDFPPYVGVSEYIYHLYLNLKSFGLNVSFHQFISEEKNPYSNIILHKGISFPFKYSHELNLLLGNGWKSFKNVKTEIAHISNPSLWKLLKYYPKALINVHDLYYINHKGNSKIMSIYFRQGYFLSLIHI